jgi:hypothetical protein
MEMGWPAGPVVPINPNDTHVNQAAIAFPAGLIADAGLPTPPMAP